MPDPIPTTTATYLPVPTATIERRDVVCRAGLTLSEIVDQTVPRMPEAERHRLRVVLVTPLGAEVIPAEIWRCVRPRPGVRVVIRTVPGGNVWRTVLMIVVTIAAVALGQVWGAAAMWGTLGISAAAATALITMGVTAIGMLLINALIPPTKRKTSDDKEYGGYSLSGWRNQSNPDGPIPAPLGRMRMAPYYAAPPYIEIVGDIQYVRAVFVWGYGPGAVSDFRFGDTPISSYSDVEIEHRYGWPTDAQLTLYTQQVIEEGLSVDLTRAWARNPDGSYSGGGTIEKPEVRYTATDVTEASVIVGMPSGLYSLADNGDRNNAQVNVRIRQRPITGGDWSEVVTLQIVAAKSVPFWRQHRWTLPWRGAWEIELTRMTDESKSSRVSDRVVWQALQSYRPEYPLNFEHPLVLTAIRIKATYQLNGQVDNFTGIFSRVAPDWDAAAHTWPTRETRSPAAALRWILQGPAATYPVSDAEIDLEALAEWSAWCTSKGLRYDRVHDAEESLADALSLAAAAGRAHPRHDGSRWSVVIDRPATLVVDHINPRNSRDFQWTRAYPKRPDGFRIKFADSSNDWKTSERVVPWPGHTGDVVVTEQLDLSGKCDPAEIWIEARRRQYEIDLRPDTFRVTQDGATRVATRGDLVAVSQDVLQRTQVAARVRALVDDLVVLDDRIETTTGIGYAIRFRVVTEADTIGTSVVRNVESVEANDRAVRLLGTGPLPQVDDIVHFGPRASESLLAFVRGEERGEDGAVVYHLVAAAPEIDELVDAEVAPAWDGRAGTTYTGGGSTPAPTTPLISSIQTGASGTGDADGLAIHLEPGVGSAAVIARFEIDHRLSGSSTWTTRSVSAAAGGASITGYWWGATVELRARAVSIYSVAGPYTATVSTTIGSADTVVPDMTTLSAERLATGSRRYAFEIPTSMTSTLIGARLRVRPGTGWTWSELAPLHSGYLTGSPWETSEPIGEGIYTIGAVAVDSTGSESRHPLMITTTLGPSVPAGIMVDRIESALGWPGEIELAIVSGGELLGGVTLPSSLGYTLPPIDLGSDLAVTVACRTYGVDGAVTLTMTTGLDEDGEPVGSARALGDVTARYISINVLVVNSAGRGRLGDVVTLVVTS